MIDSQSVRGSESCSRIGKLRRRARLFVAIAGIVWAGYIGVPSLTGGETYPLDSIAAVIIGGTTFAGGKGGIGGSIVGAIIIVFLSSFLNPFTKSLA